MPAAVLGLCRPLRHTLSGPPQTETEHRREKQLLSPNACAREASAVGARSLGGGDGSDTDSSVTNAGPHSPGPLEHPEMTAGRLKSRASTRGRPDANAQSSRPPSSVPRADGARAPRGLPSAQAAGRRREEPRVGRRGAPGATLSRRGGRRRAGSGLTCLEQADGDDVEDGRTVRTRPPLLRPLLDDGRTRSRRNW